MKRIAAVAASLTAGLALMTACSATTTTTTTSDAAKVASFNDADVQFATDMIPHHTQALSMVDLTVDKDLSPEVEALADDIRMAQTPEIEQMAGWLEEWGEPVPVTGRDHAGHDMAAMDMPGMASMDDMAALENADGPEFEQMFLSMMIEHHQGAIEMAQTELDEGANAAAKKLASEIISAQEQEIATMQSLLSS